MSTATLTQPPTKTLPRPSAAIRRFVWKEYRTLRGFWLAVLLLGLLVQWLIGVFLPPQPDWPTLRLYVALAAATLYATGAAAILFSIEHEDGTFDFLSGLPATWLPVFVGKLLLATMSAIALAAALTFTGLIAHGFDLPRENNATLAFGIFGIAILEAIAWGTLFSLLFKRPLAAAIMTLLIGALAVHTAVNLTGSNSIASLDPKAYLNSIPLRLAIVVVVLACSILVARRWIGFSSHSRVAESPWRRGARGGGILASKDFLQNPYGLVSVLSACLNVFRPLTNRLASKANRGRRITMLSRLLWQSWRESWKWLLAPIVMAALCVVIAILVQTLAGSTRSSIAGAVVVVATIFFAPALYGALAFSADQRRGQVRFLAEHAAAPRYVWLARHIVWLGTLAALFTILALVLSIFLVKGVQHRAFRDLRYDNWSYGPSVIVLQELAGVATNVATGSALASFGVLTAYAIGQLCSMVLRSEILAAFLALVLAVVLSAWVAVLFVWDLSGWLFLFPLAAGLLLATWLRAPAWLAGRNTWRAWVKPALAVIVPLVLLGLLLPQQRLVQVQHGYLQPDGVGRLDDTPETAAAVKKLNDEAEETAQMYLKAADLYPAFKNYDQLEKWRNPDLGYLKRGSRTGSLVDRLVDSGIDIEKIPLDERAAFSEAAQTREELIRKAYASAIELAIEASQRPTCQFKFNLSPTANLQPNNRAYNLRLEPDKSYEALGNLLSALSPHFMFGDVTLDQLIAALRMSAHLRSGQPATIFIRQLRREQEILQRIGQWAVSDKRTNDERREAIEKLQAFFSSRQPSLESALWADRALIHRVITGKEPPLVLSEPPVSNAIYLAFLANELPWERERALAALDILTYQNVSEASSLTLTSRLHKSDVSGLNSIHLRRWLQPGLSQRGAFEGELRQAAETSYLLRFEYDARVPLHELFREYLNTETSRRAVLIKIALVMFRLDHGEYPANLTELVPDYLDHELLDPYSMQPFHYELGGLDFPLVVSYGRGGEIERGTPLFWSVGPYNARLIQSERDASNRDETDLGAERVEDIKPYYHLEYDNVWVGGYHSTDLIFPLPK